MAIILCKVYHLNIIIHSFVIHNFTSQKLLNYEFCFIELKHYWILFVVLFLACNHHWYEDSVVCEKWKQTDCFKFCLFNILTEQLCLNSHAVNYCYTYGLKIMKNKCNTPCDSIRHSIHILMKSIQAIAKKHARNLTHCDRVTHICGTNLVRHCFR